KVRRYEELRQAASPQRLVDLLDGRLLVTRDEHPDLQLLVSEPYQAQTNRLYRLPPGPGRAWLVGRGEAVADARASLAAVLADGFDPRRSVILEGGAPGADAGRAVAADIRDIRVGWSSVALRARSDTAAYLVLAHAAYPGWSAQVDGQPAPLLTADHALLALRLPSGE